MKQFIKFALVGVLNTAITFVSYYILIYLGMYYVAANSFGYALGVINSYFFNNYWVFKDENRSKTVLTEFVIVNLLALALSTILLMIFVDQLHVSKVVAQVFVIPITMVFNFLLNKFWTFKRRETA